MSNSPSIGSLILLFHQLLTASAQPLYSSRLQCNAGACKTMQLHFRIHLRPPHRVGVPIEDRSWLTDVRRVFVSSNYVVSAHVVRSPGERSLTRLRPR